MDFSFTPEQQEYRARLRAWIAANLPEGWGGTYSGPDDPDEAAALRLGWERKLSAAGYHAVHWPKQYGGQGLSYLHYLIVSEELGRVAAPENLNLSGLEFCGPLIMAVGTEAQKQRFLRKIVAAEEVWCQGFTEAEAGSDLAAIRTSAVRDGDAWVINGRKLWTSYAFSAQWCCLLARTATLESKSKGLTLFLVPLNTPGLTVQPLAQINGRQEFNELLFDNVRIPLDSTLGEVDDGWRVANESVAAERATSRLFRQARFQNEFEHLLRIALDKPHMQKRLADDAWFRQRLARVYSLLRIHRASNLRLVSRLDAREKIGAEASYIKLLWSTMHQELSQLGLDVLGADVLLDDADGLGEARFQETYFTARGETIYAGTVQIQRNVIAERILGLPR